MTSHVRKLVDAVTLARNTFEGYAALHREKGTPDGDAKARFNAELAARMHAAIESDEREKGEAVTEERLAPVQGYSAGIPWSLHLEAYDAYREKYGKQQALIEGGCRGGFGARELDEFIPGWRDRVSEIGKLRAEVKELRAALATPPAYRGGAKR